MIDTPLYPGMSLEANRYELIEKIGNGVQAECWRIKDRQYAEQELCVKIWFTPLSARSDYEFEKRNERLDQEARILGGLHHTYSVMPHSRISTVEEIEGQEYLIHGVTMEFAREGSLEDFLKRNPKPPMSVRIKLLAHLAEAVEDLQTAGIIHNDIKPANILIMNSGNHHVAKLSDFGLAFRKGEKPVGGGTIMYMAPELIGSNGKPSLDVTPSETTDTYSLGVVFFQILTGIHPYADIVANGEGAKVLAGYFATHETIDFSLVSEAIEAVLVETIQEMCSRDPEKRPAMSDVSEIIAEVALRQRGHAQLQFLSEFPSAIDTFRWSDEVHHFFNEHEQLVFMRGSDMERDPELLAAALLARRLHGFAIHRLLGSRDYLLRIWRRDADKTALAEVLEAYEMDRSSTTETHDTVLRWPGVRTRARLPLGKPRELLNMMHALVEDADDDLVVREAIRVGLIHGRTKKVRERGKTGRRAIRAICRINHTKSMRLERARVLGDQVFQAAKTSGVREIELFANPGIRGTSAEFVLIAELDGFHRYRPMLKAVEERLSNLLSDDRSRTQLRFRSHFEMDEEAQYESYDGRLFYELYRRQRSRGAEPSDSLGP